MISSTKLAVIILLAGWTLIMSPTVWASGVTSTSTQAGQVLVRNEDGTLYLTTEVVPGQTSLTRDSIQRRFSLIGTEIQIPTGFATDVASLINAVLSLVMIIAALLVLVYLMWGAFDWLTSGGDKAKIDSARQKLIAAVVGLIIVASSYAILLLAIRFLGFTDLDDVFNNIRSLSGQQINQVPGATPSPSPSPTPVYADDLGDLLN